MRARRTCQGCLQRLSTQVPQAQWLAALVAVHAHHMHARRRRGRRVLTRVPPVVRFGTHFSVWQ